MKIFVNARFLSQSISGVQRYGIECCRQIKKSGAEVAFLAPPDIIHTEIAAELDVQVIGRNKGHLWEQLDLPWYMARQKGAPLLNLANTAPLLYSNNFVTIHDLAFYHHPEWNSRQFSMWYNILIPRLAFNSKHIFTVSETIKAELVSCYQLSASKITVTYNGISEAMLTAGRGGGEKEKIILAVGTFNKRKNHQNLISGFIESGLGGRYQLVIVGDKNKVFSEAGIDEAAVAANNIRIIATLSEPDLIAMYHRAEVVVSLSLYEGFGIPLLEGLYNGCKLVCSDIPVYREIYNEVGVFCNPMDLNSVVDALKAAVSSGNRVTETKINFMLQQFSYKTATERILGAITKK